MKALEKQILNILKEDCRYSAERIAVMLGEDEETVKAAIADMETRGVIVKYAAIVNAEAEEEDAVEALIELISTNFSE